MVAVSFTRPMASDEDGPVSVTCDHASGSMFPIGTTKVTCSASDSDDTPSTVASSFNVEVSDADLSIATIADVNATGTAATVPVSFTTPTASDEDGPVSVTCSHASGSMFQIGTTKVTCSASDSDDALDGLIELQRRGARTRTWPSRPG